MRCCTPCQDLKMELIVQSKRTGGDSTVLSFALRGPLRPLFSAPTIIMPSKLTFPIWDPVCMCPELGHDYCSASVTGFQKGHYTTSERKAWLCLEKASFNFSLVFTAEATSPWGFIYVAAASGPPGCSKHRVTMLLLPHVSHASGIPPPHGRTHRSPVHTHGLADEASAAGREGGYATGSGHRHLCHGLWAPQQLPTGAR